MRDRTFQDQINTYSRPAMLHDAVMDWNTLRIGEVVARLHAEDHKSPDQELARTSPLPHVHVNPWGNTASIWSACVELNPGFPANVAVSSPLSAADPITATSVGQPGTAKHPPPAGKLADLGAIEIDEPLSKSPAVAKPDDCERDVR